MRNVLQLYNIIKMNRMYKKKYARIKIFFNPLSFFKILLRLNIVFFIKRVNKNTYDFFINHESKIKLVPVLKKNKIYVSSTTIKKNFLKKKWKGIISTSKGLLTSHECMENKIGGLVVFIILRWV